MRNKWLVLGLVAIIILLIVVIVYKPFGASESLGDIKSEIECSCGCGYTLNDCAKYDPSCEVRPEIISEIQKMKNQGKSDQEILIVLTEIQPIEVFKLEESCESGDIPGTCIID